MVSCSRAAECDALTAKRIRIDLGAVAFASPERRGVRSDFEWYHSLCRSECAESHLHSLCAARSNNLHRATPRWVSIRRLRECVRSDTQNTRNPLSVAAAFDEIASAAHRHHFTQRTKRRRGEL